MHFYYWHNFYSGVQYITWEDGNKVWAEAEVCMDVNKIHV